MTGAGRIRRIGVLAVLTVGLATTLWFVFGHRPVGRGDPANVAEVARGRALYAAHCAACHGANLEGQPDWQRRKPDGRLPAPPHDASGHTWHHADAQLFALTKQGLAPFAPRGYESEMPAYAGILGDDEIWAILAFVKSSWPTEIRARQHEITSRTGG